MSANPMVRILLLDRSEAVRNGLALALGKEGDLLVLEGVGDTVRLMHALARHETDVVVLDVEAPGAVQAVRDIRDQARGGALRPELGVILVARRSNKDAEMTVEGLEAGAFDVVLRPENNEPARDVDSLARQLKVKLRHFSSTCIISRMPGEPRERRTPAPTPVPTGRLKALLVGASTGGPRALAQVLPPICAATHLPVLVAQHMPAKFTASLAERLTIRCGRPAAEARDEEPLKPQRIYVAPGGHHMVLRRGLNGPVLGLTDDPPIKGCRPSVDALFNSAAKVLGPDSLALILTGMGNDGLDGATALKNAGAVVLAQDEDSSVVWGMPGVVVAAGLADQILDIADMAEAVTRILTGQDNGTR